MFEKELKRYKKIGNNEIENVKSRYKDSEDAIEFIMDKNLYPEFLKFQADKSYRNL